MLAVSGALLIQALFFGDGGVTALGANCFNMAIAGSLVAYASYRVLAGRSAMASHRRVVATGIAGYLAINVSALLTAIEFGIQPMFFTDASGAPRYAPYPLAIALPAMMIGHLTVAGMAEFVVTAGLIAWLQKSHASLLAVAAPGAGKGAFSMCPLVAGLAILMLLTPLGILAVESAWGEWAPSDFTDAASRREIAAASGNHAPPAQIPPGLEKLSSIWIAPIPDYAPAFLRSPVFGYLLSAAFGMGFILLTALIADWALRRKRVQ